MIEGGPSSHKCYVYMTCVENPSGERKKNSRCVEHRSRVRRRVGRAVGGNRGERESLSHVPMVGKYVSCNARTQLWSRGISMGPVVIKTSHTSNANRRMIVARTAEVLWYRSRELKKSGWYFLHYTLWHMSPSPRHRRCPQYNEPD